MKKNRKKLKFILKIKVKNGNLYSRKRCNNVIYASEMIFADGGMHLNLNINDGGYFCYSFDDKRIKERRIYSYSEFMRIGSQMLNLKNTAKYMVQFYYYTGQKYSCTSAKIEKLLSIASLVEIKAGKLLFIEPICNKNCGIGFSQLGDTLLPDMTDGTMSIETRICDTIDRDLDCPAYYVTDITIEQDERTLLTDIFREFGGYDSKILGQLIDEFKEEILVFDAYDQMIVSCEKVKQFFTDETKKSLYGENRVFAYISNYSM